MHWEVLADVIGQPTRGAEIGVRGGNCTQYLLRRFGHLTLYAVDLWSPRPAMDRPGYETYERWDFDEIRRTFDRQTGAYASRLIVLHMDSVAAADQVEDRSLDFVFIDAEHTYEGVRDDIAAWRPKLRPGGTLAGHDYGHRRFPGVRRAVDECGAPNVRETVWWMIVR